MACKDRLLTISLSRKNTEYVRGLAILLIMLHNFCHIFPQVVSENEFTYNPSLNDLFFSHASAGNPLFIYDLLSFLGWYGVPVFVFLSGYGLTVKYGNRDKGLEIRKYMMRNWRKLLLLMIPGIVAFVIEELSHSGPPTPESAKLYTGMLIPLTGLNDLVQAWLPTIPGVYWYFGLTMELYFIYALMVHGRSLRPLLICTAICYLLVAAGASLGRQPVRIPLFAAEFTIHPQLVTEYLRHNFTGWLLPFAFGIIWAGHQKCRMTTTVALAGISLLAFIPLQITPLTWQLAAIPAVVIIIASALLLGRLPMVGRIIAFIGNISSFLFVSHPLVRHILGRYFCDFTSQTAIPTPGLVILYLSVTLLTALTYRFIWRYLSKSITLTEKMSTQGR